VHHELIGDDRLAARVVDVADAGDRGPSRNAIDGQSSMSAV
jgi:hypothetical protein